MRLRPPPILYFYWETILACSCTHKLLVDMQAIIRLSLAQNVWEKDTTQQTFDENVKDPDEFQRGGSSTTVASKLEFKI